MMASAVAQVSPLSGVRPAASSGLSPLPPGHRSRAPEVSKYPAGRTGLAGPLAPMAPVLTPPDTPSAAELYADSTSLAELKALVAARPDSASAASRYARALEEQAEIHIRELPEEQREGVHQARLREAGRMYEKAAQNARLRTYRAAFLWAAADAYRRAQAHELQYEALRRAAEEAPVSAPIWRELQQACLRTDRRKESSEAWREAQHWSLPVLRLVY
jgi:hypothetical protein